MTSTRFLLTESEEGKRLREGLFVGERHREGLSSEGSGLKLGGLEQVGLGLPSLQSNRGEWSILGLRFCSHSLLCGYR